jgi:Flp pilus assembly protein TadB
MLDGDERDKLRAIEWQINTADPELAAVLRDGQRRLTRAGSRFRLLVMIALLVLLAVVVLVLGLPAVAAVVAAVAAGLWWQRRRHISGREP